MKTLIINGQISATSNKQGNFGGTERKSIYITANSNELKKAKDFGIRVYTSKEGENFIIVKSSQVIKLYQGSKVKDLQSSVSDNNFTTNTNVDIAIMEGEKNHNKFYRVYALNVDNFDDVELIKPVNPFTGETVGNSDDFFSDIDERVEF